MICLRSDMLTSIFNDSESQHQSSWRAQLRRSSPRLCLVGSGDEPRSYSSARAGCVVTLNVTCWRTACPRVIIEVHSSQSSLQLAIHVTRMKQVGLFVQLSVSLSYDSLSCGHFSHGVLHRRIQRSIRFSALKIASLAEAIHTHDRNSSDVVVVIIVMATLDSSPLLWPWHDFHLVIIAVTVFHHTDLIRWRRDWRWDRCWSRSGDSGRGHGGGTDRCWNGWRWNTHLGLDYRGWRWLRESWFWWRRGGERVGRHAYRGVCDGDWRLHAGDGWQVGSRRDEERWWGGRMVWNTACSTSLYTDTENRTDNLSWDYKHTNGPCVHTVRSGAEERRFWGARLDVLTFRLRSYHVLISYSAECSGPKFHKRLMFLGQAGTFLSFQARRSSAKRSSTSDLTVRHHVNTTLPPSPVILWIALGDKPKWLPLNFGYHDLAYASETSQSFLPIKLWEYSV